MKRTHTLALCIFCLALWSSSWQTAKGQQTTDSIPALLDSLVEYKLPIEANAGIYVYDLTADKQIYSFQAEKLCRPASNMKILTAITALSKEETKESFKTEIWYTGDIINKTLKGDLYVVGGFDPEFDDDAMERITEAVSQSVRTIEGCIFGDISMKDSIYFGKGWLWDDVPQSYQPYLSPLILDKGIVKVTVTPTQQGKTATVEITPRSNFFNVKNSTQSHSPQTGKFFITRDWMNNDNTLIISGNIARRRTDEISVFSPQDMFMSVFVEKLQLKGVTIEDTYSFSKLPTDNNAHLLFTNETTFQTVLTQMMKESDNLNAEAVFWRLGWNQDKATTDNSIATIESLLEQIGFNPKKYKIADGCGLSMYDYLTPECIVAFLRYAYSRNDIFPLLYNSLPIGGIDGTLKGRMRRGTPSYNNVRAKTGSYTGINCLSGYLQSSNGHLLAFSIMVQNHLVAKDVKAFQDTLCDTLITNYK